MNRIARQLRFVAPWLVASLVPALAYAQSSRSPGDRPQPPGEIEAAPDAGSAPDDEPKQSPGPSSDLHPPHLLSSPPPRYPEGREGEHPTVVLRVTISARGRVTDVVVEHSAGEDFDDAAVAAVQDWQFEPARRGDDPVPARTRLAVHFEPPTVEAPHAGETHEPQQAPHAPPPVVPADSVPAQTSPAELSPDDAAAAAPTEAPPQVQAVQEPSKIPAEPDYQADAEVDAERLRAADRSAGDFTIDSAILQAVPANTASDLLKRAPGLYIANTEGGAVADMIFLRGFDSEHGQDIELKLGQVPLNQPSNIHGQGYSYLGFIIPEVVRDLRVIEGVYDPRQGDFAVAGTVEFELGVERRGIYAKSELGSFGTFRQLGIFAPEDSDPDTFGAFQFQRTDGFGDNRGGRSGSAMFQVGFGRQSWRLRAYGSFAGARYDSAGVLRLDDIEAGRVDWYDVYPYPTARAQNGSDVSAILGFGGAKRGKNRKNSSFDLWLQFHDLRLQQNFTGFLERSRTNPDWVGRGDLIEQRDQRIVFGGHARHRTARFEPADWAKGTVEMGMSGRVDLIDPQQQNLVQAPQNQTWDERVDANIVQADIGMWVDLDWDFTKYLNFKGGVRADALFFDVDDELGNFAPEFRPDNFITGFRRTAAGLAAGPRLALTGKPTEWLEIIGAYGEGFRSPQARTLVDGESAPFSKVRSADLGLRSRLGDDEELELSLTGYRTWLDKDVFFDATEGRLENIGPTTRLGFVFYAVTRPLPWLLGAFSATYVRATLDEPPPPSLENPNPPFEEGELLPFVPPWVLRLDVGAGDELVELWKYPLRGHLGLGYNFISERPLPYSQFADAFSVLDVSASLSWWLFELGFQVYNLLDKQYAANEFSFVSNWDPSSVPSRVPARHISAGAPRMFVLTLGFQL
jgi:iron complex outermembrane receptor protein